MPRKMVEVRFLWHYYALVQDFEYIHECIIQARSVNQWVFCYLGYHCANASAIQHLLAYLWWLSHMHCRMNHIDTLHRYSYHIKCFLIRTDDGIVARLWWDWRRLAAAVVLPRCVPHGMPLPGERHPVDAGDLPTRSPSLELLRICRRARRLPRRFHHRSGTITHSSISMTVSRPLKSLRTGVDKSSISRLPDPA